MILMTGGKKIKVTKHAHDRMKERVGNERAKYRGHGFKKMSIEDKIIFQVKQVLGHLAYYPKGDNGASHLFTKGYVEYVLIENENQIVVKTVIFHGRFQAEKKMKKLAKINE